MKINNDELSALEMALIKDLDLDKYGTQKYQEGKHITADRLGAALNLSERQASDILRKKYEAHVLDREWVIMPNGKRRYGYFKIEN